MTSNYQINALGDTASVKAQGYAYNRLLALAGDGFWEIWGAYSLPLERTEKGWKLTGITFSAKHSRGDASVPGHTLE